jgi:hypothetical protein
MFESRKKSDVDRKEFLQTPGGGAMAEPTRPFSSNNDGGKAYGPLKEPTLTQEQRSSAQAKEATKQQSDIMSALNSSTTERPQPVTIDRLKEK